MKYTLLHFWSTNFNINYTETNVLKGASRLIDQRETGYQALKN